MTSALIPNSGFTSAEKKLVYKNWVLLRASVSLVVLRGEMIDCPGLVIELELHVFGPNSMKLETSGDPNWLTLLLLSHWFECAI